MVPFFFRVLGCKGRSVVWGWGSEMANKGQ